MIIPVVLPTTWLQGGAAARGRLARRALRRDAAEGARRGAEAAARGRVGSTTRRQVKGRAGSDGFTGL